MKRYLLIGFLILGLISSINAEKLIDGGKPHPAEIEGFTDVQCIKLPAQIRVCKGLKDTEDSPISKIIILQNSKITGNIDGAIIQSSTELFSAFYGDLDNNRIPELVIVDFTGSSNGMGVKYNNISVFQDFEKKKSSPPLITSTEDFGKGTFVYDTAKKETLILLTEWKDYEKLDAKPGEYLIGRFYRYRNGYFIPAIDKNILARRLSNKFDDQRIKDFEIDNQQFPYSWLTHPSTKKLKIDPEFVLIAADKNKETGIIQKIETVNEIFTPDEGNAKTITVKTTQMIVQTASGKSIIFVLKRDFPETDFPENRSFDLPDDENKFFVGRSGLFTAKISFAQSIGITDYLTPAQLNKLRGTKVIMTNKNFELPESKRYDLWFVEN